jgi:nitrite reductase/ring-hydroxylating ferredoxin subunit
MTRGRLIPLVALGAVAEGRKIACAVDGLEVLICKTQGEIFVVENRCSHASSRLDAGKFKGHEITCPLHGARFDIRDGRAVAAPANKPIRTFEVILEGGKINIVEPAPLPVRPKFGPLG